MRHILSLRAVTGRYLISGNKDIKIIAGKIKYFLYLRLPVCYLVRIEKMNAIKLISIRETPAYKDIAIQYFQCKWPRELPVHADCINHCIDSPVPLPQWYLLEKEGRIIGGAGLITNDFISRMDLYPWF